jgi:predicted ATPase
MAQERRSSHDRTVLRGRDPQLGAISEGLAAALSGAGGVLLIEGPPGIGKSSLLAEARELARQAGAGVLWGESFESQQAVPFAPLLAALLDSDSPIRDLQRVGTVSGDADLRYWMLHDFQEALESAAVEAPLVLLLDDLQWADTATVGVLSTLPHRLAGSPVLWILAMRPRQARPVIRAAMARLQRDGARRLRLDALSDDDVAAIVADVLDGEADPALLELTGRARGNPFLVVELLRGLREENRLREVKGREVVVGDGLPLRLTDSMRDRLEGLSEDAQRTVTLASALGVRFTASQLAAMLQWRPSKLVPALDEARRADLLIEAGDYLRFRHDLLRQVSTHLRNTFAKLAINSRVELARIAIHDGAA